MRSYQVSFFDHRPDTQGNIARCHQRTFLIKKARDPKHALKKATHRFERVANARDWRLHTGFAEISTP
jgi:hypothetical protein